MASTFHINRTTNQNLGNYRRNSLIELPLVLLMQPVVIKLHPVGRAGHKEVGCQHFVGKRRSRDSIRKPTFSGS